MERLLLITESGAGATQTARKVISVSHWNVLQIIQRASSKLFPFKVSFNLTHDIAQHEIGLRLNIN